MSYISIQLIITSIIPGLLVYILVLQTVEVKKEEQLVEEEMEEEAEVEKVSLGRNQGTMVIMMMKVPVFCLT